MGNSDKIKACWEKFRTTYSFNSNNYFFMPINSQLRYDGFESIASTLAKVVNIISACPPMARLHQVVNLGIQAETEGVIYLFLF